MKRVRCSTTVNCQLSFFHCETRAPLNCQLVSIASRVRGSTTVSCQLSFFQCETRARIDSSKLSTLVFQWRNACAGRKRCTANSRFSIAKRVRGSTTENCQLSFFHREMRARIDSSKPSTFVFNGETRARLESGALPTLVFPL